MFSVKKILKRIMGTSFIAFLTCIALGFIGPIAALAAGPAPVDLLSAGDFVLLAESGITNTGSHACVITGNIGNSPGTAAQMNGVWCTEITGTIYGVDAAYVGSGATTCFAGNPPLANKTLVDNAVLDMMTAYTYAAGVPLPTATELGGGDISGMTLAPGLYKWSTGVLINTDVFLSGGANDVWIFQIAGDLSIASGGSVPAGIKVVLSGGAQASNIFWQVGGATGATLGTYSTFNGTILSAKQVILQTGAILNGRALAQSQITLDANVVTSQPPPGTPALGKAFDPSTILENDVSTLTITLSNPNLSIATLTSPLVDTLPLGVVIANPTNAATTCGSGIVTAVVGATTVTLSSGSTIPADGTCTVTVDVTSATSASYLNTLDAGALQTDKGINALPASSTLNVSSTDGPVALGKAFLPSTIIAGNVSTLTITLFNPFGSDATLNGLLTDTLPIGVVIAPTPNAGTTCVSGAFTPVPAAGDTSVTLSAGIIPANGSCTVTVNVTAANAGSYVNTLDIDALQTDQGNNTFPAVATLTVSLPSLGPTITKAFNSAIIVPGRGGNVNGISTLTITLVNPNSTAATLTAPLTDTLPAGVVISKPLTAGTTCGGGTSVIAAAGGTTVTLPAGRSIPAAGTCTVTVKVTALCTGIYVNTLPTDALQTSNGNNALPASATLTVAVRPTLSKTFKKSKIRAGQVSTLTITLKNANTTAASLTAPLTDTLPAGVVIAPTPNAITTCIGGAFTPIPLSGDTAVILSAGSIPARGSCRVTVAVPGSVKGKYHNSLSAGALQTDKGSNSSSASATLTVK